MKKIGLSISLVATIATTTFFLPQQSSLARTIIFAKFESVNYPRRYIRHRNWQGYIESNSTDLDQLDSSFRIRSGLADPNCVSLESKNYPNHFLRHQNFRVVLSSNDSSTLFRKDATFCPRRGLSNKGGTSYESYNFRGYYIRHRDFELWLDKFDGSSLFRDDASFWVRPQYNTIIRQQQETHTD